VFDDVASNYLEVVAHVHYVQWIDKPGFKYVVVCRTKWQKNTRENLSNPIQMDLYIWKSHIPQCIRKVTA